MRRPLTIRFFYLAATCSTLTVNFKIVPFSSYQLMNSNQYIGSDRNHGYTRFKFAFFWPIGNDHTLRESSQTIKCLTLTLSAKRLNRNNPPNWFFSIRHLLGNVLMNVGDYVGAEKIYTEELTTWPKNGFALTGLYESFKAQRKLKEADDVKKQVDAAWKYADSDLKYSRMDETKRKNLTLKVDANSPNEVIYLASLVCMAKVR